MTNPRSDLRLSLRNSARGSIGLPNPLCFMKLKSDLSLSFGVPGESFIRTSSATEVNRNTGLITTVASGVARFELNGYLAEGLSMNTLLRSAEFENVAWALLNAGNGVLPIVTANTAVAPDGATTADRVQLNQGTDSGGDDFSIIRQVVGTVTDGTTSAYIRSNTGGNFSVDVSADGTANLETITPTFQRFTDTAASASRLHVALRNNSTNDTADLIQWGAQLEDLAFASSYIPTVASAGTRTPDILVINVANIPAPTADYTVSMTVDAVGFDAAISQVLFSVDGETARRIRWNTTTGAIEATHGAVTSTSTSTFSPGDRVKIVFAVDATNQTLYINGVQEAQAVKGIVAGVATAIDIGHEAAANHAYSHIEAFRTDNFTMTPSEVALL